MNYSNRQLQSALAAEYVLGTMRGRARERFERLLTGEPGLREATEYWQRRLNPLAETVDPVQPPARVWRVIRNRVSLSGTTRPSWIHRAWEDIHVWRGLGFVSLALLVVYGVATTHYRERLERIYPHDYVAVLQDQGSKPMLVASMTDNGRVLKLDMLTHSDMPVGKVMQVWCIPKGGGNPISMGMFNEESGRFELTREQLKELHRAEEIAVSIEPSGGSPMDVPSGPVKYRGSIVI